MGVVDRKPILLSHNTCALLWIFSRHDKIFDICADLYDQWDTPKQWEEAAKEFISQFEDSWCVHFLEALRTEIDRTIAEHNKEFGIE